MEGFPLATPDRGASAGREGVGWVARVRAAVHVPPGAPGRVGMGNCEGKKAEMEGFPLATPDLGASGGREGVGWVARVRAAVHVPPGAPGRVGMGNREGKI